MNVQSPTSKVYHFTEEIKAVTSPSIRRKSGGTIYIIYHVDTDERYVGKTTAAFASRIHSHTHSARHPEKLAGQRKLAKALRRSPSKFRFRTLKRDIDVEEIADWERKYIEKYNPSLNMAAGGGGGVSGSENKVPEDTQVEIYTTPKKKYPLKRKKGRVKILLTPTADKPNVIYVFKNERTNKRLVGRTGQYLRRRVYQYHWDINSNKSDRRTSQFVRDIHANPQDFTFGILAKSSTSTNLDDLEEQCIERKEARKNGYNKNRGRGGSSVAKLNFD